MRVTALKDPRVVKSSVAVGGAAGVGQARLRAGHGAPTEAMPEMLEHIVTFLRAAPVAA